MSTQKRRQITTLLLVVGAVVFGMILAGGLELTVPSLAAPETNLSATQIAATHAEISNLPSFADLAEAVDPAIVSIQASITTTTVTRMAWLNARSSGRVKESKPSRSPWLCSP